MRGGWELFCWWIGWCIRCWICTEVRRGSKFVVSCEDDGLLGLKDPGFAVVGEISKF